MTKGIRAIFLDCGDTLIDEATEVKTDGDVSLRADLIPGAAETVRALKALGYPLALVADGPAATFTNNLGPYGLYELFDAYAISEEVGVSKPDARMFARALEAFFLQRCGLRDTLFIAMSNFYYEEKPAYLEALAEVRSRAYDLTPFLELGLRGVEIQCRRLFDEIRTNVSKALYRNQMYDLFNRLESPRKRVIANRQIAILTQLLEGDMSLAGLIHATRDQYANLKNPQKALFRDINGLVQLQAISVQRIEEGGYRFSVRLEWPTEITETEFYRRIKEMPKAKTYGFLDH